MKHIVLALLPHFRCCKISATVRSSSSVWRCIFTNNFLFAFNTLFQAFSAEIFIHLTFFLSSGTLWNKGALSLIRFFFSFLLAWFYTLGIHEVVGILTLLPDFLIVLICYGISATICPVSFIII